MHIAATLTYEERPGGNVEPSGRTLRLPTADHDRSFMEGLANRLNRNWAGTPYIRNVWVAQ